VLSSHARRRPETMTLHRPDRAEPGQDHELEQHPAGFSIPRRIAPRECRSCRPAGETLLGR
jgi:hypothetical protein